MIYSLLFLLLTYSILTHSDVSLYYAFYGFSLWYSKMIPALLPFMILSGIMVRMNLTENFSKLLHPIISFFFKCSKNVTYAIILGFLCGFPMGAKVTAELYESKKIDIQEADFLLCFINNIGPVYFCSFALPLLGIQNPSLYLPGMYGIPLLYGFLLRHTLYAHKFSPHKSREVLTSPQASGLFVAMEQSIYTSVQSILMLCGYMILFNLLNILPHFFFPGIHPYLAPFLEISGGLSMLNGELVLYSLSMLVFGGLSCIAQTYSMISSTPLSIRKYILHKCILTIICCIYFAIIRFYF